MKTIKEFWVNNNARIGQTVGLLASVAASRGWISLQTLSEIGAALAIWVGGSWYQGAKNGFKPPKGE